MDHLQDVENLTGLLKHNPVSLCPVDSETGNLGVCTARMAAPTFLAVQGIEINPAGTVGLCDNKPLQWRKSQYDFVVSHQFGWHICQDHSERRVIREFYLSVGSLNVFS